jgi:hypothetical protein
MWQHFFSRDTGSFTVSVETVGDFRRRRNTKKFQTRWDTRRFTLNQFIQTQKCLERVIFYNLFAKKHNFSMHPNQQPGEQGQTSNNCIETFVLGIFNNFESFPILKNFLFNYISMSRCTDVFCEKNFHHQQCFVAINVINKYEILSSNKMGFSKNRSGHVTEVIGVILRRRNSSRP